MVGRGAGRKARTAVYLVEGGGCGGCAAEARAALSPRYRAGRQGIVLVETPAHADLLLLCGAFPPPLTEEVRVLAQALPHPWACLHLGDCGGEPLLPGRETLLAGCPPGPEDILAALRTASPVRREEIGPPEALLSLEEGA